MTQIKNSQSGSRLIRYARWTILSLMSGLLAGLATTVFLKSLAWVTQFRDENLFIIWLLPLVGLIIGWVFHRLGKDISAGNNLIIDEIHDPKKVIPLRMVPAILLGTLATHLCGGSAGREGTAVQMGASLADQLSRFFKISPQERKILLAAGAGAGFGSGIGAPWAGMLFGMEVIHIGRIKLFAWFECMIAAVTAYQVTLIFHAPHTIYPKLNIDFFEFKIWLLTLVAGALFGITARFFIYVTHGFEKLYLKFITYSPLKPFLGGLFLIAFYYVEGSFRYLGLGLPIIQEAFKQPSAWGDPFYKIFFTALTIASGFKGGEFIPLVFIGATLGSASSSILPVSHSLLGALGFAAVFGAAANTPLACCLMAMELFGYKIGLYSFSTCLIAYYFSGNLSIYKSQKVKHPKLI